MKIVATTILILVLGALACTTSATRTLGPATPGPAVTETSETANTPPPPTVTRTPIIPVLAPTPTPFPTTARTTGSVIIIPTPTPTLIPRPTATAVPTPTPTKLPTPTPVPRHLLDVDIQPAGLGTVEVVPISDDGRYSHGSLVTTQASCSTALLWWTGDVPANADATASTLSLIMDRDRTLVAFCALPTATPTPTPIPTPTGLLTPTPAPRYRLFINGIQAPPQNKLIIAAGGTVTLNLAPKPDGAYAAGTTVVMAASGPPGYQITWGGVDKQDGPFGTVRMVADRQVTLEITPPPTPTPTPSGHPAATPKPAPTP